MIKPNGRLVLVSFTHCCASTSSLSSRRTCDGRYVVGDAIHPGAQGTAGIEALEAPPELKVNLLKQVAAFFRDELRRRARGVRAQG